MTDPFIDYISQLVTEHKLVLFDAVLAQRTRYLTVVLEDIFRSQNASACLRTCDCFGVQDVHVIESEHELTIDRRVVRGAAQWLTIHRHNEHARNTRPCIESLKQQGYRVIATTANDDHATLLPDYDVTQKTALVFGTEGEGLSDEAISMADGLLKIPMYGFTECFNISVALALCLQDLTTRLRESDASWQLSDEERDELRAGWLMHVLAERLPQIRRDFDRRQRAASSETT